MLIFFTATARSELRKVMALSVTFCLCMKMILVNIILEKKVKNKKH